MSEVRPLAADDIAAVTALYYRILRKGKTTPPAALAAYFRAFYLDGPYRDPEIPALVHVNDDGRVNGFVGVHSVPYLLGERRLRAAFCGALMSEDHESDPLAGARLLKAFISGPQDVSLSETANVISETMWTKLRGKAIPATASSGSAYSGRRDLPRPWAEKNQPCSERLYRLRASSMENCPESRALAVLCPPPHPRDSSWRMRIMQALRTPFSNSARRSSRGRTGPTAIWTMFSPMPSSSLLTVGRIWGWSRRKAANRSGLFCIT